ncbi:MAG: dihydrofolate reductase family protein [Agriterribacter sp.]
MRRIIVSQFLSLNGVMEAPEKWNTAYLNDAELVDEILADFAGCDTILLGRTSYDFFAARWPQRTGAMADYFNSLSKYVVSTSLQKAEWNNSVIVNSNVAEEIKKLKDKPGKDIIVFGSYQLCQTLSNHHLIDEYKLYIYPLTLDSGKRLFDETTTSQTLQLISCKSFSTGVVSLTYQPA